MTIEQMQELVLNEWLAGRETIPYPHNLIRIGPGDNLIIEAFPEDEDIDEAIRLIADTLNNPSRDVALITRDTLKLSRLGAEHE
jgi:hypothetical protein